MKAALSWLCVLGALVGCSQAPEMRGKIAGLSEILQQAERNGAVRCALREPGVGEEGAEGERADTHPAALQHLPAGKELVFDAGAVVVKAHTSF